MYECFLPFTAPIKRINISVSILGILLCASSCQTIYCACCTYLMYTFSLCFKLNHNYNCSPLWTIFLGKFREKKTTTKMYIVRHSRICMQLETSRGSTLTLGLWLALQGGMNDTHGRSECLIFSHRPIR